MKLFGALKGKAIVLWGWISGRLSRSRASCRSGCFLSTHRAPLNAPRTSQSDVSSLCRLFLLRRVRQPKLLSHPTWFGLLLLMFWGWIFSLAIPFESFLPSVHIELSVCLRLNTYLQIYNSYEIRVQMSTQSKIMMLACFRDDMIQMLHDFHCLFNTLSKGRLDVWINLLAIP